MTPTYQNLQTNLTHDRDLAYPVDLFVVHETAGSFAGDIPTLTTSGKVSVNWYIRRDGTLYCLDGPLRATAHAGLAAWQGRAKTDGKDGWGWANLCSEGVELEGPNDGTPVTAPQVVTLTALVSWRIQARGIPADRLVRHADISGPWVRTPAEGIKTDPRGLNWPAFIESLFPDHLVAFAPPRCTQDQFVSRLVSRHSPAANEGAAIYAGVQQYGLDPAVALAFFDHESSLGTAGQAVTNKNLGNLRAGMGRQRTIIEGFAVYDTYTKAALDWAQRLHDVYLGQWGLHTIERIIPTYAPTFDKNDPITYIAAVRSCVAGFGVAVPNATAHISGPHGEGFACLPVIKQFYDDHGGVVTFGYAAGDEAPYTDTAGEVCRVLPCENAILKYKPSMPPGWQVRPMDLHEVVASALVK